MLCIRILLRTRQHILVSILLLLLHAPESPHMFGMRASCAVRDMCVYGAVSVSLYFTAYF